MHRVVGSFVYYCYGAVVISNTRLIVSIPLGMSTALCSFFTEYYVLMNNLSSRLPIYVSRAVPCYGKKASCLDVPVIYRVMSGGVVWLVPTLYPQILVWIVDIA